MLIVGPLGLVGNSLSFIVLGYERPYTSTAIFLQSLAVADSLVLVGFILRYSMLRIHEYMILINSYMEVYNITYAYIVTFGSIARSASIYTTVCVAAERYIAVCKPLKAASICTKKNACIAVVCVVVGSFLYRFPIPFGYDIRYRYDPCVGRMRPQYYHNVLYRSPLYRILYVNVLAVLTNTFIPVSILAFITYSVVTALRNTRKSDMLRGSGNRSGNNSRNSATIRVVAVVIVYMILEIPGSVYEIVQILNKFASVDIDYYVRDPFYSIARFLSVLNSFINFFIYCATGRRFRRGLGELFHMRIKS
jgi:hypothetical protein